MLGLYRRQIGWGVFFAILLTGTVAGPELRAAPGPRRVAVAETNGFTRRVVKTFDFNEKPLGNLEEIPMDWHKITVRGFPHYVNGRFDYHTGCPPPSFCLELNGGNLGYVYSERSIPVFPGSDHKIVAFVKTENLRHARGYLKAFYIDRSGNFLPDTLVFSELITPEQPGDPEWRTVMIELPFTNPDGRFIGLSVLLVQPDQLPAVYASPVQSFRKDIRARMWVDQITVLRLPTVRFRLADGGVLYHDQQPIAIDVTVADARIDDLTARIVVHDLADDQKTILRHPIALLPSLETILTGHSAAPRPVVHSLGRLNPGLYQIALQVLSHDQLIADKNIKIAVLPEKRPPTEFGDFGLDLSTTPIHSPRVVADFAGHLKPAWTILPLWRQDLPLARTNSEPSPVDEMASAIAHRGIRAIGAFLDPPENMVERTHRLNPCIWDLLATKPEGWRSELAIVLSRHAERIDHWLFGRPLDGWQYPDPRIGSILKNLHTEFDQFQEQFTLITAWPALTCEQSHPIPDGVFLQVPPELTPASLEEYFKPWRQTADSVWVTLSGNDLRDYQLEPALVDFVHRFLQAKRSGVRHLAARDLWTTTSPIAPAGCEPNAYYVVYANLLDRLGGAEYLGDIPIAPRQSGMLFVGPTQRAVLVLSDARPGDYRSEVFLGDGIRAYDLWGRPLAIESFSEGWRIPYRPIVFIEAIDPDLARFLASIRFDPASISSRFGPQQINLRFANTFSQSISGMVRVQGPPSWQFDPSGARFVLTVDKEFILPVKLQFPGSETVGPKTVTLRFEIEAQKPLRLNLTVPLSLDAGDLDMRVLWFRRHVDLVVRQEVMNRGTRWTDLVAFIVAPDQPRLERPIRRLGPGQTAVKEYALGTWTDMLGKTIRVGFREARGSRRVNQVITLE